MCCANSEELQMPYFLIQVPGDSAFLVSDQQISLRLISNELKAVSWKTTQLPTHPGILAFLQIPGWILRRKELPQLLCLKSWPANKSVRTLCAETLCSSAWKSWDTNMPYNLFFPRPYIASRSSRSILSLKWKSEPFFSRPRNWPHQPKATEFCISMSKVKGERNETSLPGQDIGYKAQVCENPITDKASPPAG